MDSACSAGMSLRPPSSCASVYATWLPGLADVQALADAEDRGQAVLVGGLHLGVADLVGLGVVLAALGVADGHVGALQLGQHRAGDLAGVRAGVVRRDVLGAVLDLQLVAVDQGLHGPQVGEGRQDGDLDGLVVLVGQGEGELLDVGDGLEVVEVHLPVARHQRGAVTHGVQSSSAARPGSVLPSRYSRLAPPPVEMWPNAFSSKPRMRTAAAESPPPTTVKAVAVERAPGRRPWCPRRSRGARRRPSGRSRRRWRRRRASRRTARAVSGPMSRPSLSAGMASAATVIGVGRGLGLQVRELARDQDVDREHELHAVLLGALQVLLDGRDLVLLEQRDADLVALGLEEGVGHAAADEDAVGLAPAGGR